MKSTGYDPTLISLLATNIAVIVLAVVQGWTLLPLLWIYWFQSVIIGFFHFFRILNLKEFSTKNFRINNRPVKPTEGIKTFTALFFAFHYGTFHLGYLVFLVMMPTIGMLIGPLNTPMLTGPLNTPGRPQAGAALINSAPWILLSTVIFFFNHLYSYKYYKNKPKKKQNIGTIMFYPYARIVPMHLMIASGFLLFGGERQTLAVVVFLILKTGADLLMHFAEHKFGWV